MSPEIDNANNCMPTQSLHHPRKNEKVPIVQVIVETAIHWQYEQSLVVFEYIIACSVENTEIYLPNFAYWILICQTIAVFWHDRTFPHSNNNSNYRNWIIENCHYINVKAFAMDLDIILLTVEFCGLICKKHYRVQHFVQNCPQNSTVMNIYMGHTPSLVEYLTDFVQYVILSSMFIPNCQNFQQRSG
jgi:hypothetical protein